MLTRRRFAGLASVLPLTIAAPHVLRAQQQPLKLIVVVPPGATMDTIVRTIADKLPSLIDRNVVVEYRAGGTGLVASSFMKSTPPDGSHLMFSGLSVMAFFPFLYSSLPYDPEADLTPVCDAATTANALVVSNGTGVSNVNEYVEAVRRDPKLGSVGTSGLASVGAFMIVLLRKISGADIRLVAYRGGQPLLTDLIGNHVAAGQSVLSDYVEPHRAGQVKIIGVMSEKRTKLAPDIPTFKEQGFADLHGQTSMGFFARGGTPRDVVSRYAAAITKVVSMPDVRARLESIGIEATGGTPEEFAGAVKYQRERWEPVAREAGIKLN